MEAFLAVLLIAGGIGLDRWTKHWAREVLAPVGRIELWDGVFRLTYAENRGAAFSMLTGQQWFLIAVTGAVLVFILWALVRHWIPRGLARWAAYCVIAGAVGNLIDRVMQGYVIDMFDFCLINFAIFNVADVFVCVGGGLFALWLIGDMVRERRKGDKP